MSIPEAIANVANSVGGIVGNISKAKTRRLLAKTGDKVQIEENASKEHIAMLNFRGQNSFNATNRTIFDSIVDGLNRLVFPLTAFPFIALLWIKIFTDVDGFMLALGTTGLLTVVGSLLSIRQFGKHQTRKIEEKKINAAKEVQRDIIKKGVLGDDYVTIEAKSKLKKVEKFVEKFGPMAEDIEKKYDLPADGVLAHAALESGWGKSILKAYRVPDGKKIETNNVFNIKKSSTWTGPVATRKVWEVEDGKDIDLKQAFKVYDSIDDAFEDYAVLLTTKERYKPVTTTKNAKEYGQALYDCGYMTDPNAPTAIAKIGKMFIYET